MDIGIIWLYDMELKYLVILLYMLSLSKIKFLMFLYIGYLDVDDVLKMLLGNLNMVGVIFFCFFDNIVLGICFSFDIYLVLYFMYVCIRL